MRRRLLPIVLAGYLLAPGLHAQSAPLDESELLSRLAMAYSPSYISHLVGTRGITFSVTTDFLDRVKLAGGDGILVERLSGAEPIGSDNSFFAQDEPVEHIAKCAELIHTGALESAEEECRASIAENPRSPWPLLVTAKLWQSEEAEFPSETERRKKEQRDLLQMASLLGPGLAAVHLVQAMEGRNMGDITEARNANALDPEHLEGGETSDLHGDVDFAAFNSTFYSATRTSVAAEPITIDTETLRQIQIEPALASNHTRLAEQYLAVQDFEMAEREFREAIRLEPDNANIRVRFGVSYFVYGREGQGLAELREAARIVPFGPLQHVVLAAALQSIGRVDEAVAELCLVIDSHPQNRQASQALIDIYLSRHDRTSAIDELRRSLKVSAESFADTGAFVDARFQDLYRLAGLLKENHDLPAAAEQYAFLMRYKPDDWYLHVEYGNVLADLHRTDEAIAQYYEALPSAPDSDPTAHYDLALCLAEKKDFDGAIHELGQAIEMNPNETYVQVSLGTVLGQKGDMESAMKQFRKVIARNPNDAEVHASVAYALDQLKDTAAAIKELRQALILQANSPDIENGLAWIYATASDAKLRNAEMALRLARQAVDTAPEPNANYIDTLAEALLLNGRAADALATEIQALKVDPGNPEFESRLNRFQEAASFLASSKQ